MTAASAQPSAVTPTFAAALALRHELLARYRAVFGAAWQARRELMGPRRLTDERAFLPAALSLQETPPHPAPRRAALVICGLFVTALAWACLGEVDVVALAPGRIIVGERSKVVQPLETAVVRAIHVREGDTVQAGQLLVELDSTHAQADGSRIVEERRAALGEALRAHALLAASTLPVSARDPSVDDAAAVVEAEASFDGWRRTDQQAADALLQAEWQEHQARLDRLTAEQRRRQAELGTTREALAKLRATLPLARQREADYRHLNQQGFVSGHAGQDRTRERIELERDLATHRARVAESEAVLTASRREQTAYRAEARRIWQDRGAQARTRLAALAQEHAKASHRSQQTRLTAPVTGTVQQLTIHTTGGVVTPAQALMVIVPEQDRADVIAEVHIENKDIGFVHSGQRAEVKLETFNFTRYGTVPATLQWVSADAVVQATNAAGEDAARTAGHSPVSAVFPARLLLSRGDLDVNGKRVKLTPGLNLMAELKLGRRSLIDYVLSPVREHVGESMRER